MFRAAVAVCALAAVAAYAATISPASDAGPDCIHHPALYPDACCSAAPPSRFNITWATTRGNFTLVVRTSDAPLGAARLYNLAKCGYFGREFEGAGNKNGFFRVVPTFVVQWGIAGLPAVSAPWENAIIANDPVKLSNVRGTLAYAAASDPNGNACNRTTQLYINLADNGSLDGMGFSPIGTISASDMASVVDKIYPKWQQEPDQDAIYEQGDAYLQANFPGLDYVISTTVVE